MIRDTLGEDAVIVATQDDADDVGVQVTAAVDPAFEIGDREDSAHALDWLQYDDEQETDAVAEDLTDIMLRHGVPEDVVDIVISCATVIGFQDVQEALVATLEHLFSFRSLPLTKYHKPILMVGPPGSGKTLAVAKLAARGTMNGLDVGVISTDTVRAGGVEQLQAFTDLLKIDLLTAKDPQELSEHCRTLLHTKDQVLVDTAGLNPFYTQDVKYLAKLVHAAETRPVLVLPAGTDSDEAGEMARVFATVGVAEVLPTRLDIARRMGSLLAAAHQGGLSFSDASSTSQVAQGLSQLSPETLAQMLSGRIQISQQDDMIHQRSRRTGTRR